MTVARVSQAVVEVISVGNPKLRVSQAVVEVLSSAAQVGEHRFWRLNVGKNGGDGSVTIGELQLRTSIGGSQAATGGTASASSVYGSGYEADKAFDGNTATLWSTSNGAKSGWLKYAFASAVKIVEYVITARSDQTWTGQNPHTWTLEYSDDDVNWTVAHFRGGEGWSNAGQAKKFTVPSVPQFDPTKAHRWWRVKVNANNGGSGSTIGELDLRPEHGGPRVYPSVAETLIESDHYGSYTPDGLFNDSAGDQFGGLWGANGVTAYVGVCFSAPFEFKQIALTARGDSTYVNQTPKDFDIEYSDDGSTWTTAKSVTGETGWSASQKRSYNVVAPDPTKHRFWRINVSAVQGTNPATDQIVAIGELQLRAIAGGASQTLGGVASASTNIDGTYTADKAFDGTTTLFWGSAWGTPSGWLKYEFPVAVSIAEYVLSSRSDQSQPGQGPKNWTLEYSDDDSTWTVADTRTGVNTWTTAGESKTFTLAAPVTTPAGGKRRPRPWQHGSRLGNSFKKP